MRVRITYFLDVISSWCHWAEPAWTELKRRYDGVASFEWKIALMDASGLPVSHAQEEWFYRRSGVTVGSPYMLSGAWLEPGAGDYLTPNALAEAAKDLGVSDDRVRLALAEAAMLEGRKVRRWEVATPIAASAAGLEANRLQTLAASREIEDRIRASSREFQALQVTQRPTFVIDDEIGDRAVFSGLVRVEPLVAAVEAMLADCRAYASWKAHFGDPPSS